MASSEQRVSEVGLCLDEGEVLAFVERRMEGAALQRAHRHLADCASCRAWIAAVPGTSITGRSAGVAATQDPDSAMPAGHDDRIGRNIGDYRIIRKLGQGGMGEVYVAIDQPLQRKVAIKFMSRSLAMNKEAQARFLREARAPAALDHPNIATVHEVGEDRGTLYIVTSFYDGPTLEQRLARGPIPIEETMGILRQVASGLAVAHDKSIVHRDIKPSNILIAPGGIVKILDFGLAKLTDADEADGGALTRSGDTLGTAAYMSPEQIGGERVDFRTDMWALGVVAFELLTGERPFKGPTVGAVANQILTAPPPSLADRHPDIPRPLLQLISRLLDKRREGRPAHMSEIAAALELDEGEARSTPARRGRTIPLIAAGAVLVLLAAIVGWYRAGRPPTASGTQNETPAVAAAERAYRAAIDAWNSGDLDEYFAAFSDPMECFYNVANFPLEQIRNKRASYQERRAPYYPLEGLLVLTSTDSMVEFQETWHAEAPGSPPVPKRKIVRLRLIGDRWKIVAEVQTNHHKCWPDLAAKSAR